MTSPISFVAPLVYLFSKSKKVVIEVEVYTGACTHYKVSYANGQSDDTVSVKQGTGIVVINRTWNTVRFFFDDEPVIYDREFISSNYDVLNIERFDHEGNEQVVCNYGTKSFELLEGKYLHTERDLYRITDFKRELRTLKVRE